MNWNKRTRQTHRVVAIVFVATVVITVAVMAVQGPVWVSYLPLPPLALLLFSGLYLYVRPYVGGPAAESGPRRPRVRSTGVRAPHRWAAAFFVMSIVVTTVTLALQGPMWVSYLPLAPLAVLLGSGLFMLARPSASRRTGADHEAGPLDRQPTVTRSSATQ
ncbi:hypothetical protein [Nocardia flavorosea]|uniref:hypothetical protein n=1 Tax=Nocardia flavorosea TaxID=53429 RepID=UPI0007C80FC2|nr:hypothetical protein [Nocardia flavorosea]